MVHDCVASSVVFSADEAQFSDEAALGPEPQGGLGDIEDPFGVGDPDGLAGQVGELLIFGQAVATAQVRGLRGFEQLFSFGIHRLQGTSSRELQARAESPFPQGIIGLFF